LNGNLVRAIPESEVSAIKQLIELRTQSHTDQTRWKFDDRYRVFDVPRGQDEALREALLNMKRNNSDNICLYGCDNQRILSHNFYIDQDLNGIIKRMIVQL
jgi:hypothetical protein